MSRLPFILLTLACASLIAFAAPAPARAAQGALSKGCPEFKGKPTGYMIGSSTMEPAYVSVSAQQPAHAQMADSVEAAPKAKPWQGGGRSLSDVLSASQDENGPFVNPANSEYGPQGYSRNGNN